MHITTTSRWAIAGCAAATAFLTGASLVAGADQDPTPTPTPADLPPDAVVGLLAGDSLVPLTGPDGDLVWSPEGEVALLDTTMVDALHAQVLAEHPGGVDEEGNAVAVRYGDHLPALEALGAITYVAPSAPQVQRFCTVEAVEGGTCAPTPEPAG